MHLIQKLRKALEPWGAYPISREIEEEVHVILSVVIARVDDGVSPSLNDVLRNQTSFDKTTIHTVKKLLC